MLLKINTDMTSKELINLVPSINFDRNEDLIKGLATLPQLTETSNLILNLLNNTKETDFSVLKDIPNNHLHEWDKYYQEYDLNEINYFKPIILDLTVKY